MPTVDRVRAKLKRNEMITPAEAVIYAQASIRDVSILDDGRVTVEAWVLLGMIATEIGKVAGDTDATKKLATRVRGIADAVREQNQRQ